MRLICSITALVALIAGVMVLAPNSDTTVSAYIDPFPQVPAHPLDWGQPQQAIEIITSRRRNEKTFDHQDGNFGTVFGKDLHYEDSPGVWREVSQNFKRDGADRVMRSNNRYHSRVHGAGIDVTSPNTGKGVRWNTSGRPSASGGRASFVKRGLRWVTENTRTGIKTSATVRRPRGPQTYSFTYSLLGGADGFVINAAGDAEGDGFIVPRSIITTPSGEVIQASAWRIIPGPRLAFDYDDSGLEPEDYPYVIDPTTTFHTTSSNDGVLQRSSGSYPPSGTITLNDSATSSYTEKERLGTGDYDVHVSRFIWETGTLDDGAIVSAASWTNYVEDSVDGDSRSINADYLDTAIATGDWTATVGTTALDTPMTNLPANGQQGTFALDNVVANVHVDGDTGIRVGISGGVPPDSTRNYIGWITEEHASLEAPRLSVTWALPAAAVTGTLGGGATEQQVRNGAGTIIITLTGVTWNAAGTAFDNARQAIIDGLDSAGSATYGWNAEVRDELGVSSVVRTSDTIATITVAASDVADYRIDASETITVTVPASAHSGSGAITATPTVTITAAAEGLGVTGTLGGSGGTAAELRAGGETIILTLTNTEWVSAGASFNAQRQAILDNLVSSSADENGWNARRTAGDFAVGDVVRTNATVVTITLSAATAYKTPSTETITATAPAAATVYGAAITGTPTFNIVPAFALTGNRVSPAINLSSISAVAYCAIGWQATTPANTTVTAATSLDGGVTYSSATNGSCPTGIAVNDNLSAITDFRIKLTLTTSDNTVTPLVEGLGLLVQDITGPALYYQLDTVPGITITDRSANSNAGTMSFPVSQTGVNATTGVLESTRSAVSLEQLLEVGDIVSPVTGAAASGNIFNQDETGFGSLPFQSMMQTMATGGELPLKFVWVVAIGLFSIALGVVALHMTGSLMISGIGLGAGLSIGAAIGGGLIPGWTVVLFVILALALVIMRSRGALPL